MLICALTTFLHAGPLFCTVCTNLRHLSRDPFVNIGRYYVVATLLRVGVDLRNLLSLQCLEGVKVLKRGRCETDVKNTQPRTFLFVQFWIKTRGCSEAENNTKVER